MVKATTSVGCIISKKLKNEGCLNVKIMDNRFFRYSIDSSLWPEFWQLMQQWVYSGCCIVCGPWQKFGLADQVPLSPVGWEYEKNSLTNPPPIVLYSATLPLIARYIIIAIAPSPTPLEVSFPTFDFHSFVCLHSIGIWQSNNVQAEQQLTQIKYIFLQTLFLMWKLKVCNRTWQPK